MKIRKEVEELTISDVRKSLKEIALCIQESIGESSKEAIECIENIKNFENIVSEFYSLLSEYETSSFIPKGISFREYIGLKKEGE